MKPILSLLQSRKFILALLGIITLVVTVGFTPESVEQIVQLIMLVIGGIAVEDAASKLNKPIE